jgi:hypothetical protein
VGRLYLLLSERASTLFSTIWRSSRAACSSAPFRIPSTDSLENPQYENKQVKCARPDAQTCSSDVQAGGCEEQCLSL